LYPAPRIVAHASLAALLARCAVISWLAWTLWFSLSMWSAGAQIAAIVFADVVDRADVGMIQGVGGFGFTAEALKRSGCLSAGSDKFNCDKTLDTCVFRLVHHAHAATTEFFEDVIVRNGLPEK
jgi:hypothetical protein